MTPSYSQDLWDPHGFKVITERIEKEKKMMKNLSNFFQSVSEMSFGDSKTLHKLSSIKLGETEFGTLKFVTDRFTELIEITSKNEEILGSKLRTQCFQKLNDHISRLQRINTKLLNDLSTWHKSLEKEQKKLNKARELYEEKKKQIAIVEHQLITENHHLTNKQNPDRNIPEIEKKIGELQKKKIKGFEAAST